MQPRAFSAIVLFGAFVGSSGCARSDGAQPEGGAKRAARAAAAPVVSPATTASPSAPLDPRTRGWELGKHYAYTMKLSTRVDFEGAGNNFDFDITGTLEVFPRAVSSEAATLYARIGDARIVTRIPGSQGELDKLAAELRSSGAFFELNGGRAGALFAASSLSQMAASTYRHIASALQFARTTGDSRRYTAEEYDTTGKYVAEYSSGSEPNVWQKRKTSYLGILGSETLPPDVAQRVVPEVVSSQCAIRLSPEGRPLSVRLADALTLKGAQIPLASKVAIELESVPEPRDVAARPDFDALLAKTSRYGADQPILDPSAAEALDEAKIGQLDFEVIATRLEQSIKEKGSRPAAKPGDKPASPAETARAEKELQEESRLFHALSALFRKEPGTTTKAVSRVQANSPATNAIVDALGDAATPDAHRALAKILASTSISREVLGRVVMSLARTPKPTKDASLALMALLKKEPVNAGALYGLGTHSRLFRDAGKTKDASQLGEFLVARFERKNGPMTAVILLRAIANSGYIGALPRILRFLDDEDEQIRATAVRALQSMRDPRIDAMIAARLKDDSSSEVRISAIDAAKVREPSEPVVAALIDAGTKGASPHLRFRAVELMGDWLKKRPDLRATLDLVAKNDAEEKIRVRAKAAL